ncbi:MAG: hypothetical protein WAV15_02335 [Minisyncoccia bacterium]
MYSKKWKLIISLLLILSAVWLPLFNLNADVPTLLTIFSLLFAILVGFFIATSTTNYLRLQTLIAEEDASLIAIFSSFRNIVPKNTEIIADAIDNYAIAALSFELTEYVNKTHFEFGNLVRVVDEVNFVDDKGRELIGFLHDKKNSLYQTRQEIALVARRIVTPDHWLVVTSLAVLIGFLILTLRDGGLLSAFLSGILLATNYLILTLLYEVDNNKFLEQALSYQNSQQIFQVIGRPSYYVEDVIKNGRVETPKKNYRTGYYKNFDDKDIRLVEWNKLSKDLDL